MNSPRDYSYDCYPISPRSFPQRFLSFPAELFDKIFKYLLPNLSRAWHGRKQRPLPESVQFSLIKFQRIWIIDSSTLEALFCKLKSLEDVPRGQLAGKMGIVIDLMTRLPVEIGFQENPRSADTKLEGNILQLVRAQTLLLLDRGFYHFQFWQQLIAQVVMDNLSAHKRADIQLIIEQAGAKVIYLSPYSPDFNPIENCWSKLKQYLRSVSARSRDALAEALVTAVDLVTLKDLRNWFTHCCYYTIQS